MWQDELFWPSRNRGGGLSPNRYEFEMKVSFGIGWWATRWPVTGKAGHEVCVYNRYRKSESGFSSMVEPMQILRQSCKMLNCVYLCWEWRRPPSGGKWKQGAFRSMGKKPYWLITRLLQRCSKGTGGVGVSLGVGFVMLHFQGAKWCENGILTVMWGDQANYDRAEPVIQAYARSVKRLGKLVVVNWPRWSIRSVSQG